MSFQLATLTGADKKKIDCAAEIYPHNACYVVPFPAEIENVYQNYLTGQEDCSWEGAALGIIIRRFSANLASPPVTGTDPRPASSWVVFKSSVLDSKISG